jgi:transcriptional regulator with XRE-family HTH domain
VNGPRNAGPRRHGAQSQDVLTILTNGLQNVIIESEAEAMNHIGELIQSRRLQRGLSRLQLASHLGVSSQTILNIERDPAYNLGTTLLRRLEEALYVTFDLTMKEGIMNTSITMGSDEFILYIRKNHANCAINNAELGKRIFKWINGSDATADKVGNGEAVPCIWGDTGAHIGETRLPYKATQFRFERSLLPKLYSYLDALGTA